MAANIKKTLKQLESIKLENLELDEITKLLESIKCEYSQIDLDITELINQSKSMLADGDLDVLSFARTRKGRMRTRLDSLKEQDFVRILTEPDNALIKQYIALLKTEDIKLEFTNEAVSEIAKMSATVNTRTENIGARRLQTVIEKLLEDISFDAPNLSGQTIILDREKVREKLDSIIQDEDLSRYIL